MTYRTILTTKGTTTIPVEIRRQLGIKPGMYVAFAKGKPGEYVIKRSRTIAEIRDMNKQALAAAGTQHKKYASGIGFALAAAEERGGQQ
jgi:AbrB family looped-hinge helix DNA binding protein